jgi:hypothetical protein
LNSVSQFLVYSKSRLISSISRLYFSQIIFTTSSFSSGARVQVEYTISHPEARSGTILSKISSCNFCLSKIFFSVQKPYDFSFLRLILPSALHGASKSILLKYQFLNLSFKLIESIFIDSAILHH